MTAPTSRAQREDTGGERPQLARGLGLYAATSLVVGSMIGSGIFKKPAVMAAHLRSPALMLGTWLLAGVVTTFGALSNGEIAAMLPEAGGQYVFFRHIYGDFFAFAYGWAVFSVIQTGSIASIAYVFAEYLGFFVRLPRLSPSCEGLAVQLGSVRFAPLADLGLKLVTSGCIALLTAVNIVGVVLGGAVQSAFTTFKVAAVVALVVVAFAAGPAPAHGLMDVAPGGSVLGAGWLAAVGALGLALSGAFWSYDGWNNVTFVAGEVRDAQRNVPRALLVGTAAVVCVYVLTNLAYLRVLPVTQMAGAKLVAADVMRGAVGPVGGALIAALVLLSTFGSTNGSILASARVSFAMARDRLFFDRLGAVHPRFRTPHVALLAQGAWAVVLTFSGSFDQLTDMLIFVSWIFYAAAALGVIVLRRRWPDRPRPYRVVGYPVVPAVFVLFATAFVVVTLWSNPRDALLGLLLVAAGLPLYLWRRR